MTPDLLTAAAGILLSLLAAYVPPFAPWYSRQSGYKALIMLCALFLVSLVVFLLTCAGLESWQGVDCSQAGAWSLFRMFLFALISNQSTYVIAAKSRQQARTRRASR